MKNRNEILDEYCIIYEKLIKLNERIEKLKTDTHDKLAKVTSDDNKRIILDDFKKQVNLIKNDKKLKTKYTIMIKRFHQLRKILVSDSENNLITDISDSELEHSIIKNESEQNNITDNFETKLNELLEKYIPESKLEESYLLRKNKYKFSYSDKELDKLKMSLQF
jgi:hypothetical protein